MDDDTIEITDPGHSKMITYEDLKSYAERNNVLIDEQVLMKYGFRFDEANWILITKKEELEMLHRKIQANVNNTEIQNLKIQITELESEIKKLQNPKRDGIGWKGTNSLSLNKVDDEWIITEHRKSKKHGNVYSGNHYIPIKNVRNMWLIIKSLTKKDNTIRYRDVVREILRRYKLSIDIESFNGGKNRNRYLFPLYYYPIKILEYLRHIEYGGGGTIKRLSSLKVKL